MFSNFLGWPDRNQGPSTAQHMFEIDSHMYIFWKEKHILELYKYICMYRSSIHDQNPTLYIHCTNPLVDTDRCKPAGDWSRSEHWAGSGHLYNLLPYKQWAPPLLSTPTNHATNSGWPQKGQFVVCWVRAAFQLELSNQISKKRYPFAARLLCDL